MKGAIKRELKMQNNTTEGIIIVLTSVERETENKMFSKYKAPIGGLMLSNRLGIKLICASDVFHIFQRNKNFNGGLCMFWC